MKGWDNKLKEGSKKRKKLFQRRNKVDGKGRIAKIGNKSERTGARREKTRDIKEFNGVE
jgi:hypothetical protein